MKSGNGQRQVWIAEGYRRPANFEIVYHDLLDLYGPKIGAEGIGLWFAYRRFVQNNPSHRLNGLAWPSHKGLLSDLLDSTPHKLREARKKLAEAGLIVSTAGRDLVKRSQEEFPMEDYDNWLSQAFPGRKKRSLSLAELASLGIRNPATTLLIQVNDPLPFHDFCSRFDLAYYPVPTQTVDGFVWNMGFVDYAGLIRGTNRIAAAVSFIHQNLEISATDRHYEPVIDEQVIHSLLRVRKEDKALDEIRDKLLRRRTEVAAYEATLSKGAQRQSTKESKED